MIKQDSVVNILNIAYDEGLSIALNGDNLKISFPKDKLVNENLLHLIKENKSNIVAFLKSEQDAFGENNSTVSKIGRIDRSDYSYLPLSFAQERFWFVGQIDESIQHHISKIHYFNNDLNLSALCSALNELVNRHEILRTVIREEKGSAYQEVLQKDQWKIEFETWEEELKDSAVNEKIEIYLGKLFDLSNDHMIRTKIVQYGARGYIMLMVVHHIASDAWSMNLLMEELAELYRANHFQTPSKLPVLPIQYADYAIWQKEVLNGPLLEAKLNYWSKQLEGFSQLNLPLDFQRPAISNSKDHTLNFELDQKLTAELQAICQQEKVTLYMLMLAMFKVLLHKYSSQNDICIGTSLANRGRKELEGLIGCFVNLVTLRSNVQSNLRFNDFLSEVKKMALNAFTHQDTPFEKVADLLVEHRAKGINPLFQVLFVLQNTPEEINFKKEKSENVFSARKTSFVDSSQSNVHHSQFDLVLAIVERGGCLFGEIGYSADLFKPNTIKRLEQHYRQIIESVISDSSQLIAQIKILDSEEENRMLSEFNDTTVAYPSDQSVCALFERQVEANPTQIALRMDSRELSYQELEDRSNQLAHYLRGEGLERGDFVGLCLERSFETIIGILGVLKAGGVYVPIETDFPEERNRFILEDTGLKMLICSPSTMMSFFDFSELKLVLLDENISISSDHPKTRLDLAISSTSAAYLMYTSGSTGHPKGVLIKHQSIARLLFNTDFDYLNESTILYQYAPISFDASTFEIWGALLKGGQLVLASDGTKNLEALAKELNEYSVNTLWLTAGLFHLGVDQNMEMFSGLRYLLSGGDSINPMSVKKLKERYVDLIFINGYGPTESTTFAVMNRVSTLDDIEEDRNIIGRPIGNTNAYVLEWEGTGLMPLGNPGELCLSGPGLSLGYHNRDELTAEKFLENPYASGDYGQLYRTGDMVRWLEDGRLEFLGRRDNQVKIRGYRIEVGEIETAISDSGMVRQNVVLVEEDEVKGKYLLAYLLSEEEGIEEEVKSYLRSKLPSYMQPTQVLRLAEFPLTRNGKVDRKRLKSLAAQSLIGPTYVAPQSDLEQDLAEIWQALLTVEQVSMSDNFFDLGGHSLLGIRLISEIGSALNLSLTINELFEHPRLDSMAELLKGRVEVKSVKVEIQERPQYIPLSYAQERLWFIDRLTGSSHYHIPYQLRFDERLDVKVLEKSIQTIINRHEVLRTVYKENEDQVYQEIREANNWFLNVVETSKEEERKKLVEKTINAPFDLSEDHMIRGLLLEEEGSYLLVLVLHHIATDGWSQNQLIRELVELYDSAMSNREANLPELEIQYSDYSIWQRSYLSGDLLSDKLAYWKESLMGVESLNLPLDYTRPAVQSNRGDGLGFGLSKELTASLRSICQQEEVTLFMLLLSGFKVLLYKYSGQTDICVGSPIANRSEGELKNLIGFFVNSIALRSDLSENPRFLDFLQSVKSTTLSAYHHQDAPFEKVVEEVVANRELSTSPIFQVMFILQNVIEEVERIEKENSLLSLQISNSTARERAYKIAKYDLTVGIQEHGDQLSIDIEYCIDLFKRETIVDLRDHYISILESIVKSPNHRINDLEILSELERDQLLLNFNNTVVDYPKEESISELFSKQANRTPHRIALSLEDQDLTYKELEERTNQLANFLIRQGVKKGDFVGIYLDRGFDLIESVLAIIKVGACYVPLDMDYPVERIQFMINDANIKLVLCHRGSEEMLSKIDTLTLLFTEDHKNLDLYSTKSPEVTIFSDSPIYLMYTSGSSGRPKGVVIKHQSVARLIFNPDLNCMDTQTVIYQYAPVAFDASTFEIWGALLKGGRLIIAAAGAKDLEEIASDIRSNGVNTFWLTTALFHLAIEKEITLFAPLQYVFSGGEAINPIAIQKLLETYPEITFFNCYGPTESTTFAVMSPISRLDQIAKNINQIGRPIGNTKAYILSWEGNKLLPLRARGELCLSGPGLAIGYHQRPELTAEKFIENPYGEGAFGQLYRTGDMARWLPDGTIEFIGRKDSQVKIRGYRIEIGEIEAVLTKSIFVNRAIVVAQTDQSGSNKLIGYLVTTEKYTKAALHDYLKNNLPDYMIPNIMIELPELPLTANGKINEKALPPVDLSSLLTEQYQAPRNELEQKLVEIWQNLLNVETVGVFDNFFELGGHSLLAMRVIAGIRQALNYRLKIKNFFEAPSVAGLAETIMKLEGRAMLPEITVNEEPIDRIPLSFAQERLWFIDQLGGSSEYHMSSVLRLDKDVNRIHLAEALSLLVDRHQTLRSVIRSIAGETYQEIISSTNWTLQYSELTEAISDDNLQSLIQTEINKPFDLAKDYSLRAHLVKRGTEEYYLVIVVHHIASDGWSQSILVKDLAEIYQALEAGRIPNLADILVQYTDYAIWQRKYISGEVLAKQLNWWVEELQGIEPLRLPTDFSRPSFRSTKGAAYVFQIEPELTKPLKTLARQSDATLFMTLLAVFKTLLYRYSYQKTICVGTPVANRNYKEVEEIVGFFINTLVFKSDISGKLTFVDFLEDVKRTTLSVFANQDVPFEQIVEKVEKERDKSRTPIFQVMFALQNMPETSQLKLGEVNAQAHATEHKTAQYDLTFSAREQNNRIVIDVEYCTDLFTGVTIERMAQHFKNLIETVAINPNQNIAALSMLSPIEEKQLLMEFNDTEEDFSKDTTVLDLFKQHSMNSAEQFALVGEEAAMSYKELDEKSNQLAHYLLKKGVSSTDLIGICMDRSFEMIVAILGVLKTGKAYVPIDPSHPAQRIKYLIGDTEISQIITQQHISGLLESTTDCSMLRLDVDSAWMNESTREPAIIVSPDDLAYVIYTSGSTGQPKGVMISHRNLFVRTSSEIDLLGLDTQTVSCLLANYVFDVSLLEIFLPLICGGRIAIFDQKEIYDLQNMWRLLAKHEVTILQGTPGFLSNLLNALSGGHDLSLKTICIGGESLTKDLVKLAKMKLPLVKLNNHYGPTETTIDAIVLEDVYSFDRNIIGRPISNTSAYIVGEGDELVPVGVVGELLIGGEGVARGYLGKQELTRQCFIENPLGNETDRLYRTGDLARWHSDGNIEFIGRKDNQVKIRGYRIELGEVESALLDCPMVDHGVVIAKENTEGGKKLIAYVVGGAGYELKKVQEYLGSKLPNYMVPSMFVPIEELPLTKNGKIDKKALPAVDASELTTNEYVAPRNELEVQLVEIWKEQLQVEKVGVFDNFFELGGHSLLSMRMVDQISKTIGRKITIRDFYQNQSIASIVAFFESASKPPSDLSIPLNNVTDNSRPVFMIPPILGSPLVYQNLANLLANAQMSCYGFEYPGFNVGEDFSTSIETMAHLFLQEIIRKVENEEDTIVILGYSMGAIIAFELVHQLEAIGRTCQLVLLDSPVPNNVKDVQRQSLDEKLAQQFVRNHLKQTNLKLEREKQLKNLVLHYSKISDLYARMNKKVHSPILAFEAGKRKQETMLDWQDLTNGELTHCSIAEDHFGMLNQEHLPRIVDEILTTFSLNSQLRG